MPKGNLPAEQRSFQEAADWQLASSETVPDFSAVYYCTARHFGQPSCLRLVCRPAAAPLPPRCRPAAASDNIALVVTMGTGNPADIHPANKQEVARRAAFSMGRMSPTPIAIRSVLSG